MSLSLQQLCHGGRWQQWSVSHATNMLQWKMYHTLRNLPKIANAKSTYDSMNGFSPQPSPQPSILFSLHIPHPPHSFGDSLYHQYGTHVQPAPRTSSVALPLGLALYVHTGQQTKPLTRHNFFHFTSLAKMFSSSPDMVTRRLFAASSLPANKNPSFWVAAGAWLALSTHFCVSDNININQGNINQRVLETALPTPSADRQAKFQCNDLCPAPPSWPGARLDWNPGLGITHYCYLWSRGAGLGGKWRSGCFTRLPSHSGNTSCGSFGLEAGQPGMQTCLKQLESRFWLYQKPTSHYCIIFRNDSVATHPVHKDLRSPQQSSGTNQLGSITSWGREGNWPQAICQRSTTREVGRLMQAGGLETELTDLKGARTKPQTSTMNSRNTLACLSAHFILLIILSRGRAGQAPSSR